MNEDLNKWFKEKWVNIGKKVDGKHPPCGTSGEKKGYAKCVPAAKAAGMSKKEKESATRRKRAAQNDAGRGGKNSSGQGKTPIYVSTKPKNETMNIEEKLNLFLERIAQPTQVSGLQANQLQNLNLMYTHQLTQMDGQQKTTNQKVVDGKLVMREKSVHFVKIVGMDIKPLVEK